MITKKYKKIFVIFFSLIFLVCSGGCITLHMWATNQYNDKRFSEKVSQMLVSEDKKHLVVLGKQHHYVMKYDKELNNILSSSLSPYLKANFGQMIAFSHTGKIAGKITLTLQDRQYSKSQITEITRLGFKKSFPPNNKNTQTKVSKLNQPYSQKEISLYGKYYRAGNFRLPNNHMYQLNQTYTVKVFERTLTDKTATNLLLTPVTLVADGVMTIIGIPLMAIFSMTQEFKETKK